MNVLIALGVMALAVGYLFTYYRGYGRGYKDGVFQIGENSILIPKGSVPKMENPPPPPAKKTKPMGKEAVESWINNQQVHFYNPGISNCWDLRSIPDPKKI